LPQQIRGGIGGSLNQHFTTGSMYSNFCIEVDEFKFFKIIKNVLSKSATQNSAAVNGHAGLVRLSNAGDSQAETDDLASLFSKIDD